MVDQSSTGSKDFDGKTRKNESKKLATQRPAVVIKHRQTTNIRVFTQPSSIKLYLLTHSTYSEKLDVDLLSQRFIR